MVMLIPKVNIRGWDPDVSKDLNPLYYGVDRLTVPQPRMFTFGINITI